MPDYNFCIEFDGEQHFVPWRIKDKNKAKLKLEMVQINDSIKTRFCKSRGIKLFRIKFDENVEDKLKELLDENK